MKKHRGRGEGSIVRRRDGRWTAIVSLGWRDGKRRRKSIYGRTRQDVALELTSLLGKRDAGIELPSRGASVEHFLARWLDNVRNALRPRTFEKFESVVRLHIVPDLGKFRLEKLTPDAVQALLNRKLAAGASPQSVRHIRMILGLALKQAVGWNLLIRNVAAMTKGPKVERTTIHPMTADAARVFLASIENARLGSLYVLAFTLAMRRGELCGLRWDDVNLDGREIHVRQSLQRVGGRLQLLPLKTKSSIRTITLPVRAIAALKRQRVRQIEERLAAGADWQGNANGLVFTSRRGTPVEPRNVYRQFHVLLEKAGLPIVRFHDIRHTAATVLFEDGASAKQVQALLGHSRVGTTLDIYTHVTPATLDDTAGRIDLILG